MTGLVVQCFGGPCDGQLVEFVNCRPYQVYEFPMFMDMTSSTGRPLSPLFVTPGRRAFYRLLAKIGSYRYEYVETR